MYPQEIVKPMREELTTLGFEELFQEGDVTNALEKEGTTLVVVNSVCGCAAGNARPAAKAAAKHSKLPNKLTTVFAGQDKEAAKRTEDKEAELLAMIRERNKKARGN